MQSVLWHASKGRHCWGKYNSYNDSEASFLSDAKQIQVIHCVCLIFGLSIICHFITHSFAIERTFETASHSASLPAAVSIQSDFLLPSSIWQRRQVSWVRKDKTFSKSWYHLPFLYGKVLLQTCSDWRNAAGDIICGNWPNGRRVLPLFPTQCELPVLWKPELGLLLMPVICDQTKEPLLPQQF